MELLQGFRRVVVGHNTRISRIFGIYSKGPGYWSQDEILELIEFLEFISRIQAISGMTELILPEESRKLLGLAMQLHRELGCGFREKVYQDAFEVLLKENDIPYEREKHINVVFHNVTLPHDFYWDFVCYGTIGIELKAIDDISGVFEAQIINYLHVGKQALGLLVNFSKLSLEYKWYANRPGIHSQKKY